MDTLRILINRRKFLQLVATVPVILNGLRNKPSVANPARQSSPQNGYGIGAYGQDIYRGKSNTIYLPVVSKQQP